MSFMKFKFKRIKMSYWDLLSLECENNTSFILLTIIISILVYILSIGFTLAYILFFNNSKLIAFILFILSIVVCHFIDILFHLS